MYMIALADLRLVRSTYVQIRSMYESSLENRKTMLWSFHRLRIETSFSIQNRSHRSIVIRNVPENLLPTAKAEIVDWFRSGDVEKVKDSICLERAEDMLEEVSTLCQEKVTQHFDCIKFVSRTEGRVARFLAGKKSKAFPDFEDLASIMEALKVELAEYKTKGTTEARTASQRKADEDLNMLGTRLCVI